MHSGKIMAALAFGGALFAAGSAAAAPLVYTYRLDNQSGTLAGTPFAGATVQFVLNGDSTAVVPGSPFEPGQCVPAASATVSVNAAPPVTITTPLFACVGNSGNFAGLYLSAGSSTSPSHADNTMAGIDIATAGGPYPISANAGHNDSSVVLAVTGGSFQFSSSGTNSGASNFQIAAAAPPPIPTLTEWAMILFGALLAGGAALTLQRRRPV